VFSCTGEIDIEPVDSDRSIRSAVGGPIFEPREIETEFSVVSAREVFAKRVLEHLISEPVGQFGDDHARPGKVPTSPSCHWQSEHLDSHFPSANMCNSSELDELVLSDRDVK